MKKRFFKSQKDAIDYFGHTWKFIEKHYRVRYCFNGFGVRTGYLIEFNPSKL